MALWMEAGSEPKTDSEVADLEAISALKEAAAIELKVSLPFVELTIISEAHFNSCFFIMFL